MLVDTKRVDPSTTTAVPVVLHRDAIAAWLASRVATTRAGASRRGEREQHDGDITLPDIRIDTPRPASIRPSSSDPRIGNTFHPALRPNVPERKTTRMCKRCRTRPAADAMWRPWHPDMLWLCTECRHVVINFATPIAWRRGMSIEHILLALMQVMQLADPD